MCCEYRCSASWQTAEFSFALCISSCSVPALCSLLSIHGLRLPSCPRGGWFIPILLLGETFSGFNGIYFDVWKRVIVYERKKKHENLTQVKHFLNGIRQCSSTMKFLWQLLYRVRSSFFSLPTLVAVFFSVSKPAINWWFVPW